MESVIGGVTTAYVYDGEGRRVKKVKTTTAPATTTETRYVYNASGTLAAEYGPSEASAEDTEYFMADHLGSTRLVTSRSGIPVRTFDYLPFGEEIPQGVSGRGVLYPADGATPTSGKKFTGKERDAETSLDYFGARYLSGAQGRFMSPDPTRESVDRINPQTWNRYNYALNNPLAYVDRNGLWPTAVHDLILDSIFGGRLTPRQVKLLKTVSWQQDNPLGPGQSPANSNWHSQCTPAQDAGGCAAEISNYIEAKLGNAKRLGDKYGTVDDALTYFGEVAHTLSDLGSPFHVAGNGTPTTWRGTFGKGGLSHVIGEQIELSNWYRFGQSIRLVLAGFYRAFPEHASRLFGEQNAAAQAAIERFVNRTARRTAPYLSPGQEDAIRQCALGNQAACN